MYVWELVSFRLRQEGWEVRHSMRTDISGPLYIVDLRRPGLAQEVSVCGPTLTEAFAVAAKQAREVYPLSRLPGPHFARPVGARS